LRGSRPSSSPGTHAGVLHGIALLHASRRKSHQDG
jgi:hypothetical protein